jgi:hypothetical protein
MGLYSQLYIESKLHLSASYLHTAICLTMQLVIPQVGLSGNCAVCPHAWAPLEAMVAHRIVFP